MEGRIAKLATIRNCSWLILPKERHTGQSQNGSRFELPHPCKQETSVNQPELVPRGYLASVPSSFAQCSVEISLGLSGLRLAGSSQAALTKRATCTKYILFSRERARCCYLFIVAAPRRLQLLICAHNATSSCEEGVALWV